MTTKIVKIGDMDVELGAPRSITMMHEIMLCKQECTVLLRPWGAAIGACWQSGCRPQADIIRFGGRDMALYGMMVADELLERDGVTVEQIQAAGEAALDIIRNAFFGKEDVEKAKGNSEGEDGSSG